MTPEMTTKRATLSIKQPWAALVIGGAKRYEFRSWSTAHRGPLLIHAGRVPDRTARAVAALDHADPRLLTFSGSLIGEVEVEGVEEVTRAFLRDLPRSQRRFAPPEPGGYAWVIKRARPFDDPIPARGALGLFYAALPPPRWSI